jgi:hypothetical protein
MIPIRSTVRALMEQESHRKLIAEKSSQKAIEN